MALNKEISSEQIDNLLEILEVRFEKNMDRHQEIKWEDVKSKLDACKIGSDVNKLWSLQEMERTGGEPDVVGLDQTSNEFLFIDCSVETPKGRRSVCFDRKGQDSRKEHRPEHNAMDMAAAMGIEILNEELYRKLQTLGKFDLKTSSWVQTPEEIRALGGALFGDRRYDHVFIYHNGAQSYYGARGFRGLLRI